MDDSSLPGDIMPLPRGASTVTSTSAAPNAGRGLAVVSRLARSHPLSDELRGLLEGTLGAAVSAAVEYAIDAIAPATRAAYVRDWDVFAAW